MAAIMYTSYGFGRISAGTFNGTRFKHVREAAAADEVQLAKDAGTDGDGKVNLDFRITGLLPSAAFPNASSEWKTAKAYILAFPDVGDPADTTLHGSTFIAPTTLVEEDSLRMPVYNPTPAPAPVAAAASMVREAPRLFTMPQVFEPGNTRPAEWIAEAKKALLDDNYDGQPAPKIIGALLANVNPSVAKSAETLHGARAMSVDAFYDLLRTYKCNTSRVTTRAQVRARTWGPGENWAAGIGEQITAMAETYMSGDDTFKVWLGKQSAERQEEVCQDIATTIIDSAPARAASSLVDIKTQLVAQTKDFDGIMVVHQRLLDQAQVIAGFDRTNSKPGVYHVDTTTQPPTATDSKVEQLTDMLQGLVLQIDALSSRDRAHGDKNGKNKKVRFDKKEWKFDINHLATCRHCKDDPISVDGGKPGHHLHRDCPNDNRG